MLKRYVIVQNFIRRYCLIDRTAKLHSIGYSNSLTECVSSSLTASWGIEVGAGITDTVIRDKYPSNSYTIVYNSDTYPSIETIPELFL